MRNEPATRDGFEKGKYEKYPWVEFMNSSSMAETIEKLLRKQGIEVTVTLIHTDDGFYVKTDVRGIKTMVK